VSAFAVIRDGARARCEVVWRGDARRRGRDATAAALGDFAKCLLQQQEGRARSLEMVLNS
jgi:hypothetical protein